MDESQCILALRRLVGKTFDTFGEASLALLLQQSCDESTPNVAHHILFLSKTGYQRTNERTDGQTDVPSDGVANSQITIELILSCFEEGETIDAMAFNGMN